MMGGESATIFECQPAGKERKKGQDTNPNGKSDSGERQWMGWFLSPKAKASHKWKGEKKRVEHLLVQHKETWPLTGVF